MVICSVPKGRATTGLIVLLVGKHIYFPKDKGHGGGTSRQPYKLTPTQRRTKLLGAGLTLNEVDELHKKYSSNMELKVL